MDIGGDPGEAWVMGAKGRKCFQKHRKSTLVTLTIGFMCQHRDTLPQGLVAFLKHIVSYSFLELIISTQKQAHLFPNR